MDAQLREELDQEIKEKEVTIRPAMDGKDELRLKLTLPHHMEILKLDSLLEEAQAESGKPKTEREEAIESTNLLVQLILICSPDIENDRDAFAALKIAMRHDRVEDLGATLMELAGFADDEEEEGPVDP